MKPRSYQNDAVASIFNYFEKGGVGNPLVAMPTGTGKSLVQASFLKEVYLRYPGQRVVALTHVKELIEQNYSKLLQFWPTAPAGVFSAGLRRKDTHLPITLAGVGTFANAVDAFGHVDLLLIDEAHLVSPKMTTSYRKIIKELQEVNCHLKVIGLTATPYRLGQGLLTEPGGIFTDICIDMTTLEAFNWFIQEGYLSQLIPKRTTTEIDLSGVGVVGGEFNTGQLQVAVDQQDLTYQAIKETMEAGADREHWLFFATGVEHAMHIHSMLESLGVEATYVHSKMPEKERDANLAGFISGKFKAMVNNGILTTGFDFPELDLISVLRPTMSPSLWVQMLGRGTRPVYASGFDLSTRDGRLDSMKAGGKQNCLVLDFAGNTRRLGPINDPVLPRKKGKRGGQLAPIRLCEGCGTYNHASARECIECGAVFPRQSKLEAFASTAELIKGSESMPQVEGFHVDRVVYQPHEKEGKPTSLKVSYYCGLRRFQEWICFEHTGYPERAAREWWKARSPLPCPVDTLVVMGMVKDLPEPKTLRVWTNKKYPEIMGYDF